MTNQEMFDLAVKGLAKQGWERAVREEPNGFGPICVYQADDGKRCAWGHVDPSLNEGHKGGVQHLRDFAQGVAGTLTYEEVRFASEMQFAHDGGVSPDEMLRRFQDLASFWELNWPDGVPQHVQHVQHVQPVEL